MTREGHCKLYNEEFGCRRTVSLELMASQFTTGNQTQKLKLVKRIFCGVWDQNLCDISKVPVSNFRQNLNPYTTKYEFYDVTSYDTILVPIRIRSVKGRIYTYTRSGV